MRYPQILKPLFILAVCSLASGCDSSGTDDTSVAFEVCTNGQQGCDVGLVDNENIEDAGVETAVDMALIVDAEIPNCTYPVTESERYTTGSILPALRWSDALNKHGDVTPFDLEDAFCRRDAFAEVDTIVFAVGTQWCPNCPYLFGLLAENAAYIYENRGVIAWLEIENQAYGPVASASAAVTINEQAGEASGYRLGDASTEPTPNAFGALARLPSFPAFMVLRTRDMQIISPWVTIPDRLLDFIESPE